MSFLFQHYLSKFLRKWFGYDLDTGVVRRAFRPVLLPTWRVDLSMDGKGLIEDTEFQLSSECRHIRRLSELLAWLVLCA